MVRVVAWDISGGSNREVVGEFESIQVTGDDVRDPDGRVILHYFDNTWFSLATGNGWYDWTVEEAHAST